MNKLLLASFVLLSLASCKKLSVELESEKDSSAFGDQGGKRCARHIVINNVRTIIREDWYSFQMQYNVFNASEQRIGEGGEARPRGQNRKNPLRDWETVKVAYDSSFSMDVNYANETTPQEEGDKYTWTLSDIRLAPGVDAPQYAVNTINLGLDCNAIHTFKIVNKGVEPRSGKSNIPNGQSSVGIQKVSSLKINEGQSWDSVEADIRGMLGTYKELYGNSYVGNAKAIADLSINRVSFFETLRPGHNLSREQLESLTEMIKAAAPSHLKVFFTK